MQTAAVFGIYPSYASVELAVARLKGAGVPESDVSLLLPENLGSVDPTAVPAAAELSRSIGRASHREADDDGGLEHLTDLDVVAWPNVGPILVAGPVGGALARMEPSRVSLAGALVEIGVPMPAAKQYEGCLSSGAILLSVHASETRSTTAGKRLLEQTGAVHIAVMDEDGDSTDERQSSR